MHRPSWVDDDLYPFADTWTALPGGAVVHHTDEGTGTPILMVHGNPTWSFLYRDVIRGLRDRFRCVAIDLPGMGLSPAPAGFGFHAAEHAAVLAELIRELDLRDYVLLGQDWGGPVGLAAAGREPDRVAGLALANTWAWPMHSEHPPRRLAAQAWALGIGGIPGRYAVEHLNAFVEVALRGGCRKRRPSAAVLDQYRGPFPTAASRRPTWMFAREVTGAGTFLEEQVAPALAALADRPAVLPWGDADPVLGNGQRDRMAGLLADAEVVPLHGAGHFVQEDAPEELAAAVRARWPA